MAGGEGMPKTYQKDNLDKIPRGQEESEAQHLNTSQERRDLLRVLLGGTVDQNGTFFLGGCMSGMSSPLAPINGPPGSPESPNQ